MNVFVLHSALALAVAGFRVEIFTRSRQAFTKRPASGVTVHGVPAGGDIPLSKEELTHAVREFAELVAAHPSYDPAAPVHSHYWLSGLVALRLHGRSHAPWVHTMHTTAAAKHRHSPGSVVDRPRAEAEALIGRRADVLTANTEADRTELIADLGAAPARVRVVSPGIDTHVFTPHGPAAEWPLASRGARFLFAGRIQPYKGPQVAIEAIGLLARRGAPVSLVLLGDRSGPGAEDPAALAGGAGVATRVLSLPPAPHKELAAWYRAADVVLVPSRHETYGLVAAEALACGTPVIAHAVGGLNTLVHDGVDGRLLPSLDPAVWARAMAPVAMGGVPAHWRTAAAEAGASRGWDATAAALGGLYSVASA